MTKPLQRPRNLDGALAWGVLALGASGLVMSGYVLLYGGARKMPFFFAAALALTVLAAWRLRVLEKRRRHVERDAPPLLFTTDLLAGSFLVAFYFAGFHAVAEDNFVPYGLWGGGAWASALVLALLHASRRGHLKAGPRWAFTLGMAFTYIGLGCAAPLLFYCLAVPLITNFANLLGQLQSWETAPLRGAGLLGSAGVLAGQVLLWWVRKRRENYRKIEREQPSRAS